VRVLGEDAGGAAVEPLGAELAVGDSVVLVGADVAFPGAPLRPVPPTGTAGAPTQATTGKQP
jgi:hypothetical protein